MINIIDNKDCCGCSACVQVCPKQCISFQEDSEGFLYPLVNKEICIDCGLCEKVCPVINQAQEKEPLKVLAAKNPNEDIRLKSSSGGIFTQIAEKIIEEGGVVFGAKFNDSWEVVHDFTQNIEGLSNFRGSKYVQSIIGNNYIKVEEFLKEGRKVLFSGTPCQVAGLRLFIRKEYQNLLMVDIVCHGVPSPLVWRRYLKEEVASIATENSVFTAYKPNKIEDIQFRDKVKGWKKFSFTLKQYATQGAEKNTVLLSETLDKNIFMQGFLKDLYLRPSCHSCPSKSLKSGSDITLADYWGVQSILSQFDDDKGVSLILLNTAKGETLFNNLKTINIQTTYENALKGNSAIIRSVLIPKHRSEFWESFDSKGFKIIKEIIKKNKPSIIRRGFGFIKRKIKF